MKRSAFQLGDKYNKLREVFIDLFFDIELFSKDLRIYLGNVFGNWGKKVFFGKEVFVSVLYRKRGKYTRPLIHLGMSVLAGLSIIIAADTKVNEIIKLKKNTKGNLISMRFH